jgi:dipeptidyl-peptidase-3
MTNRTFTRTLTAGLLLAAASLQSGDAVAQSKTKKPAPAKGSKSFNVMAEGFSDLQTLRYQVPGFEGLSLQQKELAYYLYEAALSGRDIIWDQKSKYGLTLRKTLEGILTTYKGDKKTAAWKQFQDYAGRVFFSHGTHHHYGNEKFFPEITPLQFEVYLKGSAMNSLPLTRGESIDDFWKRLQPVVYDPAFEPKLVDLRPNIDNVVASSVNFYEGVTQKEVEDYYAKFNSNGNAPSWGLNSKTMKGADGKVMEKVWKSGGMYGSAIDRIVFWLQKAVPVAENAQQRLALEQLVKFYQTGDLKTFDDYSIAWAADTASRLDVVNGFIEVYMDPIGKKGSYESVVSLKDLEATKRISAIASQAQWFEDHSPLMDQHKKKQVKGITAKAITVIVESGDAAPSTPIGVNLPNADWIRKEHGSKSVSLSNIIHSYNVASANSGMLDEFAYDKAAIERAKKWGALASDLHTDMHECIGHASGQINPGVDVPEKTLKNYASTLEEARADLVGLYYAVDPKLQEIGVAPSREVGMTEYDSYMLNGLMTQLTRLKLGDNIEEAHMRNRQLNARWAYEMGKKDNVVEFVKRNGKTYVRINDYDKLRGLFGQLLREIQRIKSEGDYAAANALVEGYGVKVDRTLHEEVLKRYATLKQKPYRGFVQPKLVPVMKGGQMTDVKVEYPSSFFAQMLEYGKNYAYLPVEN